jgi:hypothetical protein
MPGEMHLRNSGRDGPERFDMRASVAKFSAAPARLKTVRPNVDTDHDSMRVRSRQGLQGAGRDNLVTGRVVPPSPGGSLFVSFELTGAPC